MKIMVRHRAGETTPTTTTDAMNNAAAPAGTTVQQSSQIDAAVKPVAAVAVPSAAALPKAVAPPHAQTQVQAANAAAKAAAAAAAASAAGMWGSLGMCCSVIVAFAPLPFCRDLIATKGGYIADNDAHATMVLPYALFLLQAVFWWANAWMDMEDKLVYTSHGSTSLAEDKWGTEVSKADRDAFLSGTYGGNYNDVNLTWQMKSPQMAITNGGQAILFLIYTLMFVKYCAKAQRMRVLTVVGSVLLFIGYGISQYVLLAGMGTVTGDDSKDWVQGDARGMKIPSEAKIEWDKKAFKEASTVLGMFALVCNLLLYVVPFFQLLDVVRTGVIELFPLPLTVAGTMACFCWGMYCYYTENDTFLLCNMIGFIFSLIQVLVVLWVYLKFGRQAVKEAELSKVSQMKNTSLPFMMRRKVDLRKARRKSVYNKERQGLLTQSGGNRGNSGHVVKIGADIHQRGGSRMSNMSDDYAYDEDYDYTGPTSRNVSRTEGGRW